MPTGSAGHDDEAAGSEQAIFVVDDSREFHVGLVYVDTSTHTVLETFRLLENFLQHEVWESTFLNLTELQVHGLDFVLERYVVEVDDFQFLVAANDCNVTIVQIDNLVGVFDDRGGIGT